MVTGNVVRVYPVYSFTTGATGALARRTGSAAAGPC